MADKTIEKRAFSVDMKIEKRDGDGSEPKKVMIGHAAMFNQWTDLGWFEEMVAPGAFSESIGVDDVRALFNHNENYVLGRNKSGTLRMQEDMQGLAVEIDPPDTCCANDLMVSMARGDISQMSFAFQTIEDKWEYGEEGTKDRRTIIKVKLFDVSPVTYPAYEGTDCAVASRSKDKATKEAGNKIAGDSIGSNDIQRKKLTLAERS